MYGSVLACMDVCLHVCMHKFNMFFLSPPVNYMSYGLEFWLGYVFLFQQFFSPATEQDRHLLVEYSYAVYNL